MRSNTDGISNSESNEQQRKWSENLWDKKAKDSLANYDPSRAHLNFEVTKGGKVQPIDISKSIQQKMDEILLARGIKNPNARKDVRRKQRILVAFDVPKRDVNGADAAKDDGAAVPAPEAEGAVELLPDDLVLQRIHAKNGAGHLTDHAECGHGGVAVAQGNLAVSVDALVGIDAAENRMPGVAVGIGAQYVNFCDLHIDSPFPSLIIRRGSGISLIIKA